MYKKKLNNSINSSINIGTTVVIHLFYKLKHSKFNGPTTAIQALEAIFKVSLTTTSNTSSRMNALPLKL